MRKIGIVVASYRRDRAMKSKYTFLFGLVAGVALTFVLAAGSAGPSRGKYELWTPGPTPGLHNPSTVYLLDTETGKYEIVKRR